jgi:hypothetical protein
VPQTDEASILCEHSAFLYHGSTGPRELPRFLSQTRKTRNFTFQAELLNAFNHPVFGQGSYPFYAPSGYPLSPNVQSQSFGIGGVINQPRALELRAILNSERPCRRPGLLALTAGTIVVGIPGERGDGRGILNIEGESLS